MTSRRNAAALQVREQELVRLRLVPHRVDAVDVHLPRRKPLQRVQRRRVVLRPALAGERTQEDARRRLERDRRFRLRQPEVLRRLRRAAAGEAEREGEPASKPRGYPPRDGETAHEGAPGEGGVPRVSACPNGCRRPPTEGSSQEARWPLLHGGTAPTMALEPHQRRSTSPGEREWSVMTDRGREGLSPLMRPRGTENAEGGGLPSAISRSSCASTYATSPPRFLPIPVPASPSNHRGLT
ncbi:hypothetical protein EJ065_1649 [Corallococcus coralloides]|uniref:Uncharacterized protein n=1 Tax=Corallococcus coralloides TaxID=184914 RepID=A0A410RN69_CORCK|nr:hypothetical protein EJ065_1649 [Corallococcus coralloides]